MSPALASPSQTHHSAPDHSRSVPQDGRETLGDSSLETVDPIALRDTAQVDTAQADATELQTIAPAASTPETVISEATELETKTTAPATSAPAAPHAAETKRIVVEADEIVFKAGGATLTLRNDGNGTIEIAAASIVLKGEEITSAAEQTHTTKGTLVVSEAAKFSDLLGKLIRINGQCVKINC